MISHLLTLFFFLIFYSVSFGKVAIINVRLTAVCCSCDISTCFMCFYTQLHSPRSLFCLCSSLLIRHCFSSCCFSSSICFSMTTREEKRR